MKGTTTSVQTPRSWNLAVLVLIGTLLAGVSVHAKSEPFSHIAVFGDSLSDTGNFYRLSGGYPAPPYFEGRFCNGPLWIEYVARALGMHCQRADNFAVAGATTGTSNSNDRPGQEFPGLQDEIATFVAERRISEPERALYVVAAGANDFFVGLESGAPPEAIISNGVNNTLLAIQRLQRAGAKFIVVMNVPDLGITPYALASGNAAGITQLCAAYNQVLNLALDRLAQAGIPTIRLDAFALLDQMAKDPMEYGFENVSLPFLMAPPGMDVDGFLFWDPVHPTTKAHEVLAEEALQQLMKSFSPSNGNGNSHGKCHGLHGLINRHLHRSR